MWQLSPLKGGIPPHIPPKCLRSEIMALDNPIVADLFLPHAAAAAPSMTHVEIWAWNGAQDMAR